MGDRTSVKGLGRSNLVSEDVGQTSPSARSDYFLCYSSIYHWQILSMSHFSITVMPSPKSPFTNPLAESVCSWLQLPRARFLFALEFCLHHPSPGTWTRRLIHLIPSAHQYSLAIHPPCACARSSRTTDTACQQQRRTVLVHFHSDIATTHNLRRHSTLDRNLPGNTWSDNYPAWSSRLDMSSQQSHPRCQV